jgi:hypothetical protein
LVDAKQTGGPVSDIGAKTVSNLHEDLERQRQGIDLVKIVDKSNYVKRACGHKDFHTGQIHERLTALA